MAKAKSTPVKEPKPIILTKEQYDKLGDIRDSLDRITDYLKEVADDTDKEDTVKIGFLIGRAYSTAVDSYSDIRDLTWSVLPDEDEDENEF